MVKKNSRHLNIRQIAHVAPVVVGNTRTNHLMRRTLENCQYFAFRVVTEERSHVEIRSATEHEELIIRGLPDHKRIELDQVKRSFCGILGASEQNEERPSFRLLDDPDGEVFVVVTRVPNPYWSGNPVTLIMSDYSPAFEAIGRLLSNDTALGSVLRQTGWSHPLPKTFQLVFSVKLNAVLRDSGVGEPVLYLSREYGPSIEKGRMTPAGRIP
jgi:hypothetical protein